MTAPAANANETTLGAFHLLNPPTPADVDLVRRILAHIDLDLDAIVRPYLARHFYGDTVTVQWIPENNGAATASWWGTGLIEISTQFTGWRDDLAFVLAHECGHMVDDACLTADDHAALTPVLHSGPGMPAPLTHSNAGTVYKHPTEAWVSMDNDYIARLNEAYADQFVAAFAPALWDGTATDVPCRQHCPRFVHYTSDNASIRRIVAAAADRAINPPAPAPPPNPRPVTAMTRGKDIDDALRAINHWMREHRHGRGRLRVRVAQKALRSIKPVASQGVTVVDRNSTTADSA